MPAARVARANEPEATPEPSAERAQNRHGGAPRGAVPVARDGPRFANVASRDYARDRIKDTASRRSAIPSVGDRKSRRKEKENPSAATRAGTKKTALFDIVNRKRRERRIASGRSIIRVDGNALGFGRGRALAPVPTGAARRRGEKPTVGVFQ